MTWRAVKVSQATGRWVNCPRCGLRVREFRELEPAPGAPPAVGLHPTQDDRAICPGYGTSSAALPDASP